MVDITAKETRTRRLSLLDAWMPIGFMVGTPVGVWIRNHYGLVTLYTVATTVSLAAIIYVLFVVRESRSRQKDGTQDTIHCNKSENLLFFFSRLKDANNGRSGRLPPGAAGLGAADDLQAAGER